jgi:tRNA G26 N,N-dimethylase Trm1
VTTESGESSSRQCERCSRIIWSSGPAHVCDESEAELTAMMNKAEALVKAKEKIVEEAIKLVKSERWPYLLGGGHLAHAVDAYAKLIPKENCKAE